MGFIGEFGGFKPVNRQPGTEGRISHLPVCPYYQVIEVCAQFAGITPGQLATDDRFCGQRVEFEDTLDILSGHRGNTYYPETACTNIRDQLRSQLEIVQKNYPAVDSDFAQRLMAEADPVKKAGMLSKASSAQEFQNKKTEILTSWRKTVYETSCVPSDSDSSDPHFRRRTMEDLTVPEIVSTVTKYLTALEAQVTGKGLPTGDRLISLRYPGEAQHCRQSPHFGQTGEIS